MSIRCAPDILAGYAFLPRIDLLIHVILAAGLFAAAGGAHALPPIADVHLHYKWNQRDVTDVDAALAALDANHVELAVVMGTPPDLALELANRAPGRIIPLYGVYREPGDKGTWFLDRKLPKRVRAALAGGAYRGIGEVHLFGGFAPPPDAPVIRALFDLAAEFEVPIILHTEFARANYMLELCAAHPHARIQWAHAGGVLEPREVEKVLTACPNVWPELAARDSWRYVNSPIVDANGRLLGAWRELVLAHADRFLVGSDPVWPVEQLDAWDQDDTGWQRIGDFLDFHRIWLEALPDDVQQRIRIENARCLYLADRCAQPFTNSTGQTRALSPLSRP